MVDQYQVVDVSGWPYRIDEYVGTKRPRWLEAPDGIRWLYKPIRTNDRRLVGDDWSEKVATEIGQALGVPTAHVELAVLNGARGTISKRFLATDAKGELIEDLEHGNELLSEADANFDFMRGDTGLVRGYSLDAIWHVLGPYDAPQAAPPGITRAREAFAGYLLLDGVIANMDRHGENWAVIGRRRLAESYDHAQCLGVTEPDDRRAELLAAGGNATVEKWVRRGKSRHFEGKPRLVDLAVDALQRLTPAARQVWVDRLRTLTVDVRTAIIDRIPADRMTDRERVFADRVMETNRGRVLDELNSQH